MIEFIKLNVLFITDNYKNYRRLEDMTEEDKKECYYNEVLFNKYKISSMIENKLNTANIIIDGKEYTVKESIDEILELINGIK